MLFMNSTNNPQQQMENLQTHRTHLQKAPKVTPFMSLPVVQIIQVTALRAPKRGPENNVTPSSEISSEHGKSTHLPPHVSYGGGNSQAPQIFANDVNIRRPTPYPYGALANLMGPTKTPRTSLHIVNDAKIIDRPSTPFKPQREGIHAEEMRLLDNGIAESEHLLAKDILRIRAELGLDNTANSNRNGTVRPQDTLLNHGTNTVQAGDSSDTGESATSSRVKPVRVRKEEDLQRRLLLRIRLSSAIAVLHKFSESL
ncbi:hypothetical protein M422DRAFT_52017 [Sphaerobolus stellatus SS14]|uniref:Uncharacterized protein n=1 Tax=Sphaerobolus stellatus (strain SS14) TaxID=990650 RepID=A0A0C9TVM1_SPHS4|nr:hypothetical protein M422DRAFT_52017 [Sphaerobolus stellatus SS14]